MLALLGQTDPPPEIDWLTRAGVVGVMAYFLWALMSDRIVSGKTHHRVIDERDRLLELAITNAQVSHRSLEIAEKTDS